MEPVRSISDYLRAFSPEIGERVVQTFPALHNFSDPVSPHLRMLKRKPFPGQEMAIMGIVKAWEIDRSASAIAECGTGKTLIALASMFCDAAASAFTAIAMVPPQLVLKWARECFLTLPDVRVFVIDGIRNGVSSNGYSGVNEVRLRDGHVRREGLKTTLSDLRLSHGYGSARERWRKICPGPAVFLVSRERAKLSWFWKHAYRVPRSGPYVGCAVNPDTGVPVATSDDQLRAADFRKAKHAEVVEAYAGVEPQPRRTFFSPLWQADRGRLHRAAPATFIAKYMKGFFDYAIADEVHELANDTAQGQALGSLACAARKTLALTGTYSSGYADSAFNNLFRLHPSRMIGAGFEFSAAGLRAFAETYGVLERVTTIEPADNACSEARVTKQIKRRPGASPLLFGHFLMDTAAFLSLEDIAEVLPPYSEEVLTIEMDSDLQKAYAQLESDVKDALQQYRGNASVLSASMHALLLYPDRPFAMGDLVGWAFDPDTERREKVLISTPADLGESNVYAKERRLIEELKSELSVGRKCQVFAVYSQKKDVTLRLKQLLLREGMSAEVLTSDVPPERREAWYEERLRRGMQVCIANPKLLMTGLDLLEAPSLFFYETGYSTHVLRQASRRSWRIGQRKPVRVCYMSYAGTAQERCLRLMGKKMQVSLALEGKLASHGLTAMDDDDDVLTALARELVNEKGIGERAAAVWKSIQMQSNERPKDIRSIEGTPNVSDSRVQAAPITEAFPSPRTPARQLSFTF